MRRGTIALELIRSCYMRHENRGERSPRWLRLSVASRSTVVSPEKPPWAPPPASPPRAERNFAARLWRSAENLTDGHGDGLGFGDCETNSWYTLSAALPSLELWCRLFVLLHSMVLSLSDCRQFRCFRSVMRCLTTTCSLSHSKVRMWACAFNVQAFLH